MKMPLFRNPKAIRVVPFIARVNIEVGSLSYLNPKTIYENGFYVADVELSDNNFYLICQDFSSHKHPRVILSLIYVENSKCKTLLEVEGGKVRGENKAVELYKHYRKRYDEIESIIKVAQWYRMEHGMGLSEENLIEELKVLCAKYNITIDKLKEIVNSL